MPWQVTSYSRFSSATARVKPSRAALVGYVVDAVYCPARAVYGRHVEEASKIPLAHIGQGQPYGVKRGRKVDRQRRIPVFRQKIHDRREMAYDGVVDEMSMAPKRSSVVLTRPVTALVSPTFASWYATGTPVRLSSSPHIASTRLCGWMLLSMMRQPACAKPSAIAKPKPPVEPVTTATRPCNGACEVLTSTAPTTSVIVRAGR